VDRSIFPSIVICYEQKQKLPFCGFGHSVIQEATAQGDPDMLRLLLKKREQQRHSSRLTGIPALLRKLQDVSTTDEFA
jgi:hypothetical protein